MQEVSGVRVSEFASRPPDLRMSEEEVPPFSSAAPAPPVTATSSASISSYAVNPVSSSFSAETIQQIAGAVALILESSPSATSPLQCSSSTTVGDPRPSSRPSNTSSASGGKPYNVI